MSPILGVNMSVEEYWARKRLKQAQAQEAAAVRDGNWDYWTVLPTCPPSTSIRFIGGRYVYPPSAGAYNYWGWGGTDNIYDLTNWNVTRTSYVFTNPYWYAAAILVRTWSSGDIRIYGPHPPGYGGGNMTEFETAGEAEASIDDWVSSAITEIGIPLCRIVFRNDGRTEPLYDASGTFLMALMPIDMNNRGRSYLWGHFRRTYKI
jgi:hypothetical protein